MARSLVASVVAVCALAGCQPPPASEPKVWSASNSADGFAQCPVGTTVVGGGYEFTEAVLLPGRLPHVTASRPHGNGWQVQCVDDRGAPTNGCKAWVVCASVLR
ncbi:MAG: hypothetical protein IT374_06050 [Polyangiaceae bacterium]|nr:hypothetical protein [Polyangiaceae bacterium]